MQIKYAAIKGFIVLCIAFLTNHQAKSVEKVQPKGFVQHAYVKLNAFLIKHFAERASDQSASGQEHASDQSASSQEHASDQSASSQEHASDQSASSQKQPASSQKIDFLHYIIKYRTTDEKDPLAVQKSKDLLIGNYKEKIKKEDALFAQYTLRGAIKDPYFWGLTWALSSVTYLHPNFKNQSFSLHPNFKNQSFSRQGYWVAGSYAVAAAVTIAFRQFILKPIAQFSCAQNIARFDQEIQEVNDYEYNPDGYKPAE